MIFNQLKMLKLIIIHQLTPNLYPEKKQSMPLLISYLISMKPQYKNNSPIKPKT
jgi:hypothetical protein